MEDQLVAEWKDDHLFWCTAHLYAFSCRVV